MNLRQIRQRRADIANAIAELEAEDAALALTERGGAQAQANNGLSTSPMQAGRLLRAAQPN